MKTALVVFGGQGTGKSMLFEAVAKIYGEYGSIVGQTQIDSVYTGWASRKLFVIADEVLSQREARVIKNRLKSLITGDEIIIEEKYRQARTEQNSMNLVFLSNENTPVVLEQDDRRFTVVEFQSKQSKEYYAELADEINSGGIQGLLNYLINYDLNGFNNHTPPFSTVARAELIDVSLEPQDKFFEMWEVGELPIPLCSAATTDLYEAFKVWCVESGEKWRIPTFTAFSRSVGKRYSQKRQLSLSDGRRATVVSPDGIEILSASAMAFRERLTGWLDSVKARKIT
jgi:putative DNA primase/helicase